VVPRRRSVWIEGNLFNLDRLFTGCAARLFLLGKLALRKKKAKAERVLGMRVAPWRILLRMARPELPARGAELHVRFAGATAAAGRVGNDSGFSHPLPPPMSHGRFLWPDRGIALSNLEN